MGEFNFIFQKEPNAWRKEKNTDVTCCAAQRTLSTKNKTFGSLLLHFEAAASRKPEVESDGCERPGCGLNRRRLQEEIEERKVNKAALLLKAAFYTLTHHIYLTFYFIHVFILLICCFIIIIIQYYLDTSHTSCLLLHIYFYYLFIWFWIACLIFY